MSTERFSISLDEKDIDLFERSRTDINMSRQAFFRLLLAEHHNNVPTSLKYRKIIESFSELNTSIKTLILTDKIEDVSKIYILEKMEEIHFLLENFVK